VKKSDVIQKILGDKYWQLPLHASGKAFAPTNIALCKYWGKRDQELNLPMTSSLSISLGDKGATAEIKLHDAAYDVIFLNGEIVNADLSFAKRLITFLNLFRVNETPSFFIDIQTNIPIAAGLASSAAGFASIVMALNDLYGWVLSLQELSILARLGSGSASRSLWQGFVEWHVGEKTDGMDSFAESIADVWPGLCVGLMIVSDREKKISSREAMQRTVSTSPLYAEWPAKVAEDLVLLKEAINSKNFLQLGLVAESNARRMHETMLGAEPPVNYFLPETLEVMRDIWELQKAGLEIFFTQDAGPNIKLLFLKKDLNAVLENFPQAEILQPFIRSV
jgi:diphosphomevalonate decarboxylase